MTEPSISEALTRERAENMKLEHFTVTSGQAYKLAREMVQMQMEPPRTVREFFAAVGPVYESIRQGRVKFLGLPVRIGRPE